MFVHKLYIIVFCVSVQSSFGYNSENVEVRDLLRFEDFGHNETASSDGITTTSDVQNDKVCDKAGTLQKILGVIISTLRQDIPENAKTAYILETFKDLLKNTAGDNDAVMYKINDLMATLDKYIEPGASEKKTFLRVGSNNENSLKMSMLRQTLQPNQNIKLKYELPALTNSYCTEALLNIVKIAHQAYVSLAKNPICNLPRLPELPSAPDKNPIIHFLNPVTLKPVPDSPPSYNLNVNAEFIPSFEYILNPNPKIIENSGLNPHVQYKPIREYFPNTNNIITIDHSNLYPFPNQPFVPNNPIFYELRPPYLTENRPNFLNFSPQNPEVLPVNYNPQTPGSPDHPYEPRFKHNPDVDLLMPTDFPWQAKKPDFPFDSKPNSQPLNSYVPNADNPQERPELTVPYPWLKRPAFPFNINPQELNLNGPNVNSQELIFKIPIQNKPKKSEVNPTLIDYLYPNPNSYKYTVPQPLPKKPLVELPEYFDAVNYSPDDTNADPTQPNVFEFPYESETLQPHNFSPFFLNRRPEAIKTPNGLIPELFPVKSLIQNLDQPLVPYNQYRPNTINPNDKLPFENLVLYPEVHPGLVEPEQSETEIYEFNLNPNEYIPYIPTYPYIAKDKNRVNKFEPNPNTLHPNVAPIYPSFTTNQNSVNEFEFNPSGHLSSYLYMPNPASYNWPPNTPSELTPQDLKPFLPLTPPKTLPVPELKIISDMCGFIRYVTDVIEGVIPLVKFDPETLVILAKIKDILVHKDEDIEVEEFVTVLELYKKLINYVKQLNLYKEIIDTIDLSRVTNRPKLETQKVVELTYLVKRPQPLLYYPYFYVKYRLPFASYVVAAKKILKQKPHLRMNSKELYEELLSRAKVADTSPDLKNYKQEDILNMTVKSGSLVDTKLVQANGTLNEQLNMLRDITSDLTTEDLLELNKESENKLQLLASNPESLYNNKTNDFISFREKMLVKRPADINDGKLEKQQQISPLLPNILLKVRSLVNTYPSDPEIYSATEPSLEFTSFKSHKLRDDILRGEYVGLPFSDYVIPSIVNPHANNEPDPKLKQKLIAPALYNNLFDATLKANSDVQGQNQRNLMDSGGLVNQNDEKITLNTRTANHQKSTNVYNPKVVINLTSPTEGLVNIDGRTSLDANQQNFMNAANDQSLVNKHNIRTNQRNYYYSSGLVNDDNQKILLNERTGNHQNHVNFMNPKVMLNKGINTNDLNQQNLINLNAILEFDETKQDFPDTANARLNVTNQQSWNDGASQKIFNGAAMSHGDLVNFGPNMVEDPTSRQNLINVDSNQISLNSNAAKEQEISNKIKNPDKEEFQYANSDASNMFLNTGQANKLNLGNFNLIRQSDGTTNRPFSSQDFSNIDVTKTLLNSGFFNSQNLINFNNNQMTVNSEAPEQDLINYDNADVKQYTGTGYTQNSINSNNNNMILNAETENQSERNLNLNTGLKQQSSSVASQQNLHNGIAGPQATGSQQYLGNFNYDSGIVGQQFTGIQRDLGNLNVDTGMAGQQAISSQQNFANVGMDTGLMGHQIKRYWIQKVPIMYQRQIYHRFPMTTSPFPFVTQFRKPVTFG